MQLKKLLSYGIAAVITFSTLTTNVMAAESIKCNAKETTSKIKYISFYNFKKFDWNEKKHDKKHHRISNLEAIKLLVKMLGLEKDAEAITTVHPSYKGKELTSDVGYVYVAIEKKILSGSDLETFNPFSSLKKYEAAKYIVRAIGKEAAALEKMNAVLDFKDAASIPKDCIGYVAVAHELGILKGSYKIYQPMKAISLGDMEEVIKKAKKLLDQANQNQASGTFVALDAAKTKITIKQNNLNTEYALAAQVIVQSSGTAATLESIKAGDSLKLTLNSEKKVTAIEIIKTQAETRLTVTNVSYDQLPASLKTQIDTLKLTINYKVFRYANQLYLVAALGEKPTTGYSITIKEAYKLPLADSKNDIKAVVEITEPSSTTVTAQVINYPYHIVRLDNIDNLQSIKFVNTGNTVLAQATVTVLDSVEQISGVISQVDTVNKKVKVTSNNVTTEYGIPAEAGVTLNGINSQLSAITANMNVIITKTNNVITLVAASDNIVESTGQLILVSGSTEKSLVLKIGTEYKSFFADASTVYLLNNQRIALENVPLNSIVVLKQVNGILKEVKVQ